jgi:predicted CopG family antitoxin
MAVKDLNKMLSDVKKNNMDIDAKLKMFLMKYDGLYQEANRQFHQERTASGSMKGLEDFYYMVQTIKRNRDVVSSLVRGITNLRSLKNFSIIEEDIPEHPVQKKKPGRKKQSEIVVPEPVLIGSEEGLNG